MKNKLFAETPRRNCDRRALQIFGARSADGRYIAVPPGAGNSAHSPAVRPKLTATTQPVLRDGQQRDADGGAAAEIQFYTVAPAQVSQDDGDHRHGGFRQRPGHQRAGAVRRAGVEGCSFPGDKVKAGEPLAEVDSPDFAAAISAYRKALATAQTLRRVADMDKDLIQHNGVAQREAEQAQTDAANAEADRDAALQTLVSLNLDPQTIKDLQAGRPVSRVPGPDPLADRRDRGGKTDHARRTAAGGHHAVFHRGRSFARLGDGADFRLRPGFGQRRRPGRSVTGIATNSFSGTVDNISALVDPTRARWQVRVVVENPGRLSEESRCMSAC
jgi:hypothetical protein